MSLHAQLSPDAIARLQAQRRNSTISSIIISMLTIILIGLILGMFLLPLVPKEVPLLVTYEIPEEVEPTPEPKPKRTIDSKPTPTSTSMTKVIATTAPTNVFIPVPEVEMEAPSLNFGDNIEFAQNWAGDNSFTSIPVSMKKRCSQSERMERLKEAGGNEKCEKAVVKALDFLQETQNGDGSWDDKYQPAMTGLALLAYLGHCETPKSPRYGDTVLRAITYLVDVGMKNDGKLTTDSSNKHWSYEHAVCTYALGEAYTFCKELRINVPNLEKVVKEAGQLIVDKQGPNGGWGYGYKGDGDLSIIGWQLQALKAVDNSGIKLKNLKQCIDKALTRLEKHQTPDGGFNYSTNGSGPKNATTGYRNLTGVGVLCLQIWGKGKSKAALKGVEYISQNSKFAFNERHSDIYGHYYDAQAMINHGGREWDQYNDMIRDELLKNQERDGSWKMPKMAPSIKTPTYRTTLITLTLEVYYRFLPSADGSH